MKLLSKNRSKITIRTIFHDYTLKQYKDRRGEIVSSGSEKEALRARLGALREPLRALRAIFEVLSVLIRVLKVKLGAIRVILGRPRPMLGAKFDFFDT